MTLTVPATVSLWILLTHPSTRYPELEMPQGVFTEQSVCDARAPAMPQETADAWKKETVADFEQMLKETAALALGRASVGEDRG